MSGGKETITVDKEYYDDLCHHVAHTVTLGKSLIKMLNKVEEDISTRLMALEKLLKDVRNDSCSGIN